MGVTTITISEAKTHPIRVDINTSVAKGYFTGHAKVMTKAQVEEMRDQVLDGEYEGRDEDLLRAMYDRFEGFGEGDGFKDVLEGPASAYLSAAASTAFFEQFGEARKGNSRKRRGR